MHPARCIRYLVPTPVRCNVTLRLSPRHVPTPSSLWQLRLWDSSSGECLQSITHPSTVWSCTTLPNGDLAAGCADANAYVWTRTPGRAAHPDMLAAFKENVAAVALPAQQVGWRDCIVRAGGGDGRLRAGGYDLQWPLCELRAVRALSVLRWTRWWVG